jgi:hypothetical protein
MNRHGVIPAVVAVLAVICSACSGMNTGAPTTATASDEASSTSVAAPPAGYHDQVVQLDGTTDLTVDAGNGLTVTVQPGDLAGPGSLTIAAAPDAPQADVAHFVPLGGPVDIHVEGLLSQPLTITYKLPISSEPDPWPMILHHGSDDRWSQLPGRVVGDTITVETTELSIYDLGKAVLDDAKNFAKSIASLAMDDNAPDCPYAMPEWGELEESALDVVLSCGQTNKDTASGAVRAEVKLRSNRQVALAVTVPPAHAYVWVEHQPEWFRQAYQHLLGLSDDVVILQPDEQMSIGFDRPSSRQEWLIPAVPSPHALFIDLIVKATEYWLGKVDPVTVGGLIAYFAKCSSWLGLVGDALTGANPKSVNPIDIAVSTGIVPCLTELIKTDKIAIQFASEAMRQAAEDPQRVASRAAQLQTVGQVIAVLLATKEAVAVLGVDVDQINRMLVTSETETRVVLTAPPRAQPNPTAQIDCKSCEITGQARVPHPAWGEVTVVTALDDKQCAHLYAINASGTVLWNPPLHQACGMERFALNAPPLDGTGNVFIVYNPGRYNGVIILQATDDGFADFEILPSSGDLTRARFYSAELTDSNGDGVFEIKQTSNDCRPDCATGNHRDFVFQWNGTNYTNPSAMGD